MELGPRVGKGRTADIFVLDETKVVKLFQSWMPVAVVEKEYHNAQMACEADLPVPGVYEVIEINGQKGIVYEYIHGASMLDAMRKRPWQLDVMAKLLADLQFDMHRRKGAGFPLQQYGREELKKKIGGMEIFSRETKALILERLDKLPPGEAICHMDFHVENVLMTAKGPVIVDWMNAEAGNPFSDVARTLLLLGCGAPPPGKGSMLVLFLRRRFRQVYLRHYLRRASVTREQVEEWLPVLAAARLFENIPEEKERLIQFVRTGIGRNDYCV